MIWTIIRLSKWPLITLSFCHLIIYVRGRKVACMWRVFVIVVHARISPPCCGRRNYTDLCCPFVVTGDSRLPKGSPGPHSWYVSESCPSQLCDGFYPNLCSGSASEASLTSERRQKAPIKWPTVQPMTIVCLIPNSSPLRRLPFWKTLSANQSCSFNCKWLPPMEDTIFEAELHSE